MLTSSSMDDKIARAKAEIQRIQAERIKARKDYDVQMRALYQTLSKHTAQLKEKRDAIQRNITVHKYAGVLRDNETPNAILVLQAKLCRQIHIVCVEKAQLKLITDITKRLSNHGQQQIAQVMSEHNILEMEIINKMSVLQRQEKDFQESCQQRIRTQSLEIATLHRDLSDRSIMSNAESESALDDLLDRISELNTKLQDQKNGKLILEQNDPSLLSKQGSFRKDKPLSKFEMRARAMQQRAVNDNSPKLARSLTKLSASIRNLVTDLSV